MVAVKSTKYQVQPETSTTENAGSSKPKGRSLLTSEQVEVFTEVFHEFDRKGKGTINSKQLGLCLKSLGMNLTEAEMTAVIQEVDTDGNGSIDLDEFLDMMQRKMAECDELRTDELLRHLFNRYDLDSDGYISPSELELVMQNLGEKMSKWDIASMIKDADADGDYRVGFEDFKKLVTDVRLKL